jgi:hypothetical protein
MDRSACTSVRGRAFRRPAFRGWRFVAGVSFGGLAFRGLAFRLVAWRFVLDVFRWLLVGYTALRLKARQRAGSMVGPLTLLRGFLVQWRAANVFRGRTDHGAGAPVRANIPGG